MDDNNKNNNIENDLLEIKAWGQKLNVKPPELAKQRWKNYNSAQVMKVIRRTAPWWGMVAALLVGIYLGRTSHHWSDQGLKHPTEQNLQQDETFESVYSNY